jgi:hypothetical protein
MCLSSPSGSVVAEIGCVAGSRVRPRVMDHSKKAQPSSSAT